MPNRRKKYVQYTDIKRKLYKTNAAIWYNKTCRGKQLTPKYRVTDGNRTFLKWLV